MIRGALIGCGFFADFHASAWTDIGDVEIVAACDVDAEKAHRFADKTGISKTYTDADEMLAREHLDFVDIVTQPDAHRELVELAARHRTKIICQKPLAPSLDAARAMVNAARDVTFMVHENFRWQRPMRRLKAAAQEIGDLFFGRIHFRSGYDVYTDQPYLAEGEHFIIYDMGVHLLDLARFFFGEMVNVYALTQRVNPAIAGEDVATIVLRARSGASVIVDLSYASKLETERFPQTLVHIEGSNGSAVLGPDYDLAVTTPEGTRHEHVPPLEHAWSRPPGVVVQDSIVNIQRHWVACLAEGREPETSGRDNLETLELVFGAYESAETGNPYSISSL